MEKAKRRQNALQVLFDIQNFLFIQLRLRDCEEDSSIAFSKSIRSCNFSDSGQIVVLTKKTFFQDLFAMSEKYNDRPPEEESINDPTNPRHYWRYRMHVNLETLLEDEELANEIDTLLKSGSRGKSYWMGKRCWLSTNGSKNL